MEKGEDMSTVLVTGGSGFIGVHTILQLLAAGHDVRTTVRNPDRSADVIAMLREWRPLRRQGRLHHRRSAAR